MFSSVHKTWKICITVWSNRIFSNYDELYKGFVEALKAELWLENEFILFLKSFRCIYQMFKVFTYTIDHRAFVVDKMSSGVSVAYNEGLTIHTRTTAVVLTRFIMILLHASWILLHQYYGCQGKDSPTLGEKCQRSVTSPGSARAALRSNRRISKRHEPHDMIPMQCLIEISASWLIHFQSIS